MLHIGTTGSQTPFLPENELPEIFRLSGNSEDEDKQMAESRRQLEESEMKVAMEKSKRQSGKTNWQSQEEDRIKKIEDC